MDIIATYWLCDDCTVAAANDDTSGLADARAAEVSSALAKLGHLSAHYGPNAEGCLTYSSARCNCCAGLAGARTRFVKLG